MDIVNELPDGFILFNSLDAMRFHDQKVDFADDDRFRQFLESHKDDPDVAKWLAEHKGEL